MDYKLKANKVRAALGFEIKLAQMKLADGITVLEAESFEAGYSVGISTADGIVPLPVGEYELEDGQMLEVEQEGVIASIEMPAPQEEQPSANENPAAEVPMEAAAQPKRVVESISKETFFAEIEKLKAEFSAQIEELKSLKSKPLEDAKEEVKLSDDEPAVEPIVSNPEKEDKEIFNFGQNRVETIQDRVFEKLFN